MRTRIRNVRVFDGTRLWDAPADVMFDETGILENDSAPADVEIDGTGKTLTPGLMDGHVHMGGEGMEPPVFKNSPEEKLYFMFYFYGYYSRRCDLLIPNSWY